MSALAIDALERRALAFTLASRLTAWPDAATLAHARALAEALDDGDDDELRLAALAGPLDAAQLEPEYIALFENGPRRCPIHETEYGRMRGMSKGNELADLAGFFTAFGLERADGADAKQMHDHLAVELEFYGTLLARQAVLHCRGDAEGPDIVEDARRKFLRDHLGRLAGAVATQPPVRESAAYGPLLEATAALVRAECARLGVTPAPLDFFESLAEPEALCCGGAVSARPAAS
ncbi:MAG: TorD/DmsD family molecular chaperone [Myxococcota bacterium]